MKIVLIDNRLPTRPGFAVCCLCLHADGPGM